MMFCNFRAFLKEIDHRRGCFLNRSPCHIDDRPVMPGAELAHMDELLGDEPVIDIIGFSHLVQ